MSRACWPWGDDLEALRSVRQGMRAGLEGSLLRDEARLVRDLEAAYRGMWASWCGRSLAAA